MGPSGYSKAVNSMVEIVNLLILGKNELIKYCTKLIPSQPVINRKSHPPKKNLLIQILQNCSSCLTFQITNGIKVFIDTMMPFPSTSCKRFKQNY